MVAVTQSHPLYTYTKRGVYYFNRYVPSDLRSHYRKHRIVKSLKTSSARDAARSARMLAAKLDQVWLDIRLKKQLEEAESCLVAADTSAAISSAIKLSGAVEQYIETKGVGRADIFNYIELFYKPKRRHGNNDGLSPVQYEKQYLEKLAAV